MSGSKQFEDLEVWRKARTLTKEIYAVASFGQFFNDYALKRQIREASISVMSNISEGFERDGNREFVQFLYIAKGSCGEIRSQLYVALDQNYVSERQFHELYDQTIELSRALSCLITYLRHCEMKGRKYK